MLSPPNRLDTGEKGLEQLKQCINQEEMVAAVYNLNDIADLKTDTPSKALFYQLDEKVNIVDKNINDINWKNKKTNDAAWNNKPVIQGRVFGRTKKNIQVVYQGVRKIYNKLNKRTSKIQNMRKPQLANTTSVILKKSKYRESLDIINALKKFGYKFQNKAKDVLPSFQYSEKNIRITKLEYKDGRNLPQRTDMTIQIHNPDGSLVITDHDEATLQEFDKTPFPSVAHTEPLSKNSSHSQIRSANVRRLFMRSLSSKNKGASIVTSDNQNEIKHGEEEDKMMNLETVSAKLAKALTKRDNIKPHIPETLPVQTNANLFWNIKWASADKQRKVLKKSTKPETSLTTILETSKISSSEKECKKLDKLKPAQNSPKRDNVQKLAQQVQNNNNKTSTTVGTKVVQKVASKTEKKLPNKDKSASQQTQLEKEQFEKEKVSGSADEANEGNDTKEKKQDPLVNFSFKFDPKPKDTKKVTEPKEAKQFPLIPTKVQEEKKKSNIKEIKEEKGKIDIKDIKEEKKKIDKKEKRKSEARETRQDWSWFSPTISFKLQLVPEFKKQFSESGKREFQESLPDSPTGNCPSERYQETAKEILQHVNILDLLVSYLSESKNDMDIGSWLKHEVGRAADELRIKMEEEENAEAKRLEELLNQEKVLHQNTLQNKNQIDEVKPKLTSKVGKRPSEEEKGIKADRPELLKHGLKSANLPDTQNESSLMKKQEQVSALDYQKSKEANVIDQNKLRLNLAGITGKPRRFSIVDQDNKINTGTLEQSGKQKRLSASNQDKLLSNPDHLKKSMDRLQKMTAKKKITSPDDMKRYFGNTVQKYGPRFPVKPKPSPLTCLMLETKDQEKTDYESQPTKSFVKPSYRRLGNMFGKCIQDWKELKTYQEGWEVLKLCDSERLPSDPTLRANCEECFKEYGQEKRPLKNRNILQIADWVRRAIGQREVHAQKNYDLRAKRQLEKKNRDYEMSRYKHESRLSDLPNSTLAALKSISFDPIDLLKVAENYVCKSNASRASLTENTLRRSLTTPSKCSLNEKVAQGQLLNLDQRKTAALLKLIQDKRKLLGDDVRRCSSMVSNLVENEKLPFVTENRWSEIGRESEKRASITFRRQSDF